MSSISNNNSDHNSHHNSDHNSNNLKFNNDYLNLILNDFKNENDSFIELQNTKPIEIYVKSYKIQNITENILQKQEKDPYMISNLEKSISYLLPKFMNTRKINTLRMICHSNLMKSFLLNITELNKIKKIIKYNAWSIMCKTNNINIVITRHGYSTANYIQDSINKKSSTKLMIIFTKWRNELDPGLTVWGIITCIMRSINLRLQEKFQNIKILDDKSCVYVSILVRTWMTAICLYLPEINIKSKSLVLCIAPFIKEHGSGNGKDNMPDTNKNQISKFTKFLNYLLFMYDIIIKKSNTVKNAFINQITKIYNFFKKGKVIILKHINRKWEFKLKDNKIQYFEIINNNSNNIINVNEISVNEISVNEINKNKDIILFNDNDIIKLYNGIKKPNYQQINKITQICEPLANKYNYKNCTLFKIPKRINKSKYKSIKYNNKSISKSISQNSKTKNSKTKNSKTKNSKTKNSKTKNSKTKTLKL